MIRNSFSLLGIALISFSKDVLSSSLLRPESTPSSLLSLRGGASGSVKTTSTSEKMEAIQKYKLQQQHLLQLRSTYLSEALALRGIHVGPTMMDVATPEGNKPPQVVDWDCCLSTVDDPKVRRIQYECKKKNDVKRVVGGFYTFFHWMNFLCKNLRISIDIMSHLPHFSFCTLKKDLSILI